MLVSLLSLFLAASEATSALEKTFNAEGEKEDVRPISNFFSIFRIAYAVAYFSDCVVAYAVAHAVAYAVAHAVVYKVTYAFA